MHERALLEMDVARHLMAFEAECVRAKGAVTTAEACRLPPGSRAIVVGNSIRLRFPPTASVKRVVFWDLEDHDGLLNCTAFNDVYQDCGDVVVLSQYASVVGTIQDRDGHSAIPVRKVFPYQPMVLEEVRLPVGVADFLSG